MDITKLILHPDLMDHETLYDLRSLLALYPYYQTARLLLLQNLYILHDTSFDEELRRAAIYLTDRKVIFNLVEAAHYRIKKEKKEDEKKNIHGNRTISLIDDFLDSIPTENSNKAGNRKPTPADAALDYVSYLLETESEEEKKAIELAPQLKGQSLIDDFIFKEGGKITLKDDPETEPTAEELPDKIKDNDEEYFTETLAKIYIKQGRYSKALEIIQQLNLNYPKKNAYFADQMRFLEKLILNNKNK
ncbi:tetratricopeptide repeat protein [Hoylesella oralis]|uniref:tetratricopeptide repeat protein n=1 Tax=Hoylesella oralis TaxID=28134 RepID=UPI0028E74654|nr:tetratricopeptide repeat protein [Hoylesella oralis]